MWQESKIGHPEWCVWARYSCFLEASVGSSEVKEPTSFERGSSLVSTPLATRRLPTGLVGPTTASSSLSLLRIRDSPVSLTSSAIRSSSGMSLTSICFSSLRIIGIPQGILYHAELASFPDHPSATARGHPPARSVKTTPTL